MERVSLNGPWRLRRTGETESIMAIVPGTVHQDLQRSGRIGSLLERDHEASLLWISEADWDYERTFTAPAAWLSQPNLRLVCAGLDTLATVTLNGVELGRTDNMFRTWEFDVQGALRAGENTLQVHFASPMAYLRARDGADRALPAWNTGEKVHAGGWLRKEPCSFGWDWGPKVVTSGIWREIALVSYAARISDLHITQAHTPGQVTLGVAVAVEGEAHSAHVAVFDGAVQVASATVALDGGAGRADLAIADPKLWWVAGMGDQPLYRVEVLLASADGAPLDSASKRIGLRTLTLDRHADAWGESFQFTCNGVPFFAKGANWIPADIFLPSITRERYASLIGAAAGAHMNMLRVWGGGIYEDDAFYDLCDEMGIAVWQDFMFACATYPGFDAPFCASVREEAIDNIRRLRHHPSIALWCGNNEMEQGLVSDSWTSHAMSWADYGTLFDTLLPGLVAAYDPQRDYWPSSPHNPTGSRLQFNNPDSGDAHLWTVWHGKEPFEWYRTCQHRFISEFGFQSFPEASTLIPVTAPEDRNLTSYVMEYRQRSGIGNTTIMQYLLDWFRLPTGFERTLNLTQILQGMAMKYAVEHWRRGMPRTMGTLYWKLNDIWQAPSWAGIDYHGQWKALHFMARRFYAPLLISGVERPETGTVEIHLTSDHAEPLAGAVRWLISDAAGTPIERGSARVCAPARASELVHTLDVSAALASHGPRNLLIWLAFEVSPAVVSENLVLFARPKHLMLAAPTLTVARRALGESRLEVTVTANAAALWVWLAWPGGPIAVSDNYFHLAPNHPRKLIVTLPPGAPAEAADQLVAHSLVDTYAEC